jgi:hypothetical protein
LHETALFDIGTMKALLKGTLQINIEVLQGAVEIAAKVGDKHLPEREVLAESWRRFFPFRE